MITICNSIIIKAPIEETFGFVSDLRNDKTWRKEINSTTMTSEPQVGAIAKESSFLSKRAPNHILQLMCTELVKNKKVVYRTTTENPILLESTREVTPVGPTETKMTYCVTFDEAIIKIGLGFMLPRFMVKFVAQQDMKKYLKKLKVVLEKN